MANEYLLEMTDITKSFPGVMALDKAHLRIRPGTVHALMGENGAGKSTLMKCLFGIYHKDSGTIHLDGEEVSFTDSAMALQHHVSMVHQELNQVPNQTVIENMWLGRYPTRYGIIDHKQLVKDTQAIFQSLDLNINPNAKVGTLQVAQKQMVEIAKAISYHSKILVLDEPTSSLTEKEVEHLFSILETLKKQQMGIIFITHRMEEVMAISDDVTVMRDGKTVITASIKEITQNDIIRYMVGREIGERYPQKKVQPHGSLLKVENLSSKHPAFEGVSFELKEGEILGISGLVGSKRTELLEALFGCRQVGTGTISLRGKEIKNRTPLEAMQNGFAMVTEERRSNGIYAHMSVEFNILISNLNKYTRRGLLSNKLMAKDANNVIQSMNIKTPSYKTPIATLSGGNQQKAIIGRWLLLGPDVLLLDEPTRGIDIGAKYEIYKLINALAEQGKGIIVVSSEMPELFGICDRLLVMSNGRQSAILYPEQTDQVEVMEAAAKYV